MRKYINSDGWINKAIILVFQGLLSNTGNRIPTIKYSGIKPWYIRQICFNHSLWSWQYCKCTLPLAAPPSKLYFTCAHNTASYAGYLNHFVLVIFNSYYTLWPCLLALDLELKMKKTLVSETVTGPEENYLVAQKKEKTIKCKNHRNAGNILLNKGEILRISSLTYESNPGYIVFSSHFAVHIWTSHHLRFICIFSKQLQCHANRS